MLLRLWHAGSTRAQVRLQVPIAHVPSDRGGGGGGGRGRGGGGGRGRGRGGGRSGYMQSEKRVVP